MGVERAWARLAPGRINAAVAMFEMSEVWEALSGYAPDLRAQSPIGWPHV